MPLLLPVHNSTDESRICPLLFIPCIERQPLEFTVMNNAISTDNYIRYMSFPILFGDVHRPTKGIVADIPFVK